MARQRSRAQASWKAARRPEVAQAYRDLGARQRSRFEGYEATRLDGVEALALLDGRGGQTESLGEGDEGEVLLEATPFYAESGGQDADTGYLVGPDGRAEVLDVHSPVVGLSLHRVRVESGRLTRGQRVAA